MPDPEGSEDEPEIVRSQIVVGGESSTVDLEEKDTILPSAIHHLVDESRAESQLLQHYNYIVYDFERDDLSCRARTYVDTIDEVALLGLATNQGGHRKVPDSAFRDDVLRYLKRRFHHITELGEGGYETLWRRSMSPTTS